MNLSGIHQLLVYADDVNILGERIHTKKENIETFVVANKENGIEVNADKTKYTIIYRDQNAGRSHAIRTDNRSFERAKQFIYLVITFTNQNSNQEDIKSKLKSVNAC